MNHATANTSAQQQSSTGSDSASPRLGGEQIRPHELVRAWVVRHRARQAQAKAGGVELGLKLRPPTVTETYWALGWLGHQANRDALIAELEQSRAVEGAGHA